MSLRGGDLDSYWIFYMNIPERPAISDMVSDPGSPEAAIAIFTGLWERLNEFEVNPPEQFEEVITEMYQVVDRLGVTE